MFPEFFPDDDFANSIFLGLTYAGAILVILWWTLFIIGTVEQIVLYLRKKKSEGTE